MGSFGAYNYVGIIKPSICPYNGHSVLYMDKILLGGGIMLELLTLYFMVGIGFACAVTIRMVNGQYKITRTNEFTKKMSDGTFVAYCFVMAVLIWPKIFIDNL